MATHRDVAAEDRTEDDEDADDQTHLLTQTPNTQPASRLPAFCRASFGYRRSDLTGG
jgi:hypothetical protein